MAEHPDQDAALRPELPGTETDRQLAEPQGQMPTPDGPVDSEIDLPRLRESMQWSGQKFEPFQKNHADAITLYAGSRYGRGSVNDKTPFNVLRLAIDIWSRQLVSSNPRCLMITRAIELRMAAYELELGVNHLLGVMNFGSQLSSTVHSALFLFGVMKVGLTEQYLSDSYGLPGLGGQPYAEPVLIEDFLFDLNARTFAECEWMGNKYRVPYDEVMENPNFDEQAKASLPRHMSRGEGEGMMTQSRKASDLSGTQSTPIRSEYRDQVELWDIYFPKLKRVVTFAANNSVQLLQEKEWEGPSSGPYHVLTFSEVPGNIIPAAPAQSLYDMQDLLTRVFNQLGRQALRQKTLTIVDMVADEDGTGQRVMDGDDGHVITTSNIEGVKEMKYGGVDASNMKFAMWIKEVMSYLAGNLDTLGGLAPQAKTLGQEQLLAASSSEMVRGMQNAVVTFTKKVMSDLAWYMYTNPVDSYKLEKKVEGFGSVPFEYGPDKRDANFYAFHLDVQSFSLQSKTPQERLAAVMQIVQNVIMPMAPQFAEWGISINFKELIEIISKYSDLPELMNVITSEQLLQGQSIASPGMSLGQNPTNVDKKDKPGMPPVTQRNYTRQSIATPVSPARKEADILRDIMKEGL